MAPSRYERRTLTVFVLTFLSPPATCQSVSILRWRCSVRHLIYYIIVQIIQYFFIARFPILRSGDGSDELRHFLLLQSMSDVAHWIFFPYFWFTVNVSNGGFLTEYYFFERDFSNHSIAIFILLQKGLFGRIIINYQSMSLRSGLPDRATVSLRIRTPTSWDNLVLEN